MRLRCGLTQAAVAKKLGVTVMAVWRWENGERNPSLRVLKDIARIFECSIDELLNGPTEETREFTLIYDREGDLRMEVLNMAANAPEQRVMSVSPQRIAAMVNIKTANLDREEAKKMMLDEMAARFDEAWAQQEKWKEAGA